MSFIIIYVTHKDLKSAKKVANHLLNKHLIACANYFPITSSYWWNGKIENSNEIVSLLKTSKNNWTKVRDEIKQIHPYKTPCIMKLNVTANKDYEDWITKETK